MSLRTATVAVLMAAALGAGGCGDDEEEDRAVGGLAPEAREQARAACIDAAPRAQKVLGAKSIPDFERYARQARAVVAGLRRELDGINPGEDGAGRWATWLAAIDADLKAYRLLELAGSVRNRGAVLDQNAKLGAANPARLARDLGLPFCAEVTNDAANTFDR